VITGDAGASARRVIRVMRAVQKSLCHYQPTSLPLTATLFVAANARPASHAAAGWKAVLQGRVHTVAVGGTHTTMLEPPHIDTLTRGLARALGIGFSPSEGRVDAAHYA
jgi:thioesterase domain-containing protein